MSFIPIVHLCLDRLRLSIPIAYLCLHRLRLSIPIFHLCLIEEGPVSFWCMVGSTILWVWAPGLYKEPTQKICINHQTAPLWLLLQSCLSSCPQRWLVTCKLKLYHSNGRKTGALWQHFCWKPTHTISGHLRHAFHLNRAGGYLEQNAQLPRARKEGSFSAVSSVEMIDNSI